MLKRFGLIFSSGLLKIALVSLALTAAGWATFGTSDNLKQAAEESKLYDSAVTNVLESAKQEAVGQDTQLPVNEPEIEQAAKDAFSSNQLSKNGASIIDGFYGWLQGKTDQPEFNVDLTESKKRFADNVANYAQERYEGLPSCTPDQLRSLSPDIEPFSLECRAPGLTGAMVRERVLRSILDSSEFLQDGTFTSDDLPKDANGDSVTEQLPGAPEAYKALSYLPWLLGFVSVLLAASVLFLSDTKRKGFKSVGITLLGVGIFLALGSLLINWAFKQMNGQAIEPFQNSVFDAIKSLVDIYNNTLLKFAAVYAALGAGILLSLWYQNRSHKPDQTEQKPETRARIESKPESEDPKII